MLPLPLAHQRWLLETLHHDLWSGHIAFWHSRLHTSREPPQLPLHCFMVLSTLLQAWQAA